MKARLGILSALLLASLLLGGCSGNNADEMTAGSVEEVEEPAEEGITQEEAQAIFDQLAEAVGTEGFQAMASRRSQVESVTLTYFDLVALMTDALNQDIAGAVYAVAPNTEQVFYHEESFPGSGQPATNGFILNEPLVEDLKGLMPEATSEWLFDDAWGLWYPAMLERNHPEAHEVLYAALIRPVLAQERNVSVDGTNTILVTYPDELVGEWTHRYLAEERDGGWVIVAVPTLKEFAVAEVSVEQQEPTDEDVLAGFGQWGDANTYSQVRVTWKGTDTKGDWWAAVDSIGDGLGDSYATLGHLVSTTGEWTLYEGAPDMYIQADSSVPNEIIEALESDKFVVNVVN